MIKLGSLFAGIGGFDLGAQWAFDRAGIPHKVLFQVEQNKYCQSILKKHWPDARIFDDVCAVGRHNLPDIDILMGGFPCQDISVAGHQKGVINGEKSSLWFEMLRIISELRPRVAVLENVPAIIRVGGPTVVGGLAEIGYDCEWQIISAKQFGAPHLRKRWFCVATDTNRNTNRERRENRQGDISCEKGVAFVHETDCEWKKSAGQKNIWYYCGSNTPVATANTNRSNSQAIKQTAKNNPCTLSQWNRHDCLNVEVAKLTGKTKASIGKKARLSPQFVVWMMGFPIEWLD